MALAGGEVGAALANLLVQSAGQAFDEVQRIAVEQEPIVYLVNPDYLCAIAPNLKGTQPSVTPPQVWWNVEWLRLE